MRRKMATRDQTRDGTSVTQRSEVVKKIRIICGEIIEEKATLFAFSTYRYSFLFIAANGLTPFYDSLFLILSGKTYNEMT